MENINVTKTKMNIENITINIKFSYKLSNSLRVL